ncbi:MULTISPECIES: murein hydrolase activator EnvC family protein [unclassified Colwellia]|uniref:murein hydrolase activator EnvC family protein n=1 Tax=unclassified Colwellia TaxID=196834 RepID=UPI0015F69F7D|nr:MULTISPECIES: peptidoglycan DD-metalloendopeptidase family protein [unclassified Colwellia]MBA6234337.1 peptidoglycan DD-metalloendopeptidase family protein [Colwellia sp. MB02u-7]MBA6237505.1 peptidoglycan DD-metalloendopeptidase family protein [Colwellia sp. MB02u-11]MBA6256300.1 peptidoglycan DD-metalloendopeptidase family protein [Colwellia sp. MB3u-28]MBA6260184.1 peptidoglycan DD-metalloendopeptidase family protein [Colwellia sp. MB3u-41]MBA6300137.1 peptidoglycan DD-metalloendopeptid
MKIFVKKILLFASIVSLSGMLMSESLAQQSSDNENNQQKTNQALSKVQQQISDQQKSIKQTSNKRSSLEKQLRNDDISIAKIVKAMIKTNTNFEDTQLTLKNLTQEKVSLTHKKQQQEKVLAQQLRAAYTSGNHDYLKLLLNQKSPASVERTVTYYKYLNDARIKEIDQFQIVLSDLLAVTTQHQEQAKRLNLLKQQQTEQKVVFQGSKQERKNTLRAINKELLNSKQLLAKLVAEEENLVVALQRIATLSQQSAELVGLKKLKRKLSWPIKGKISHRFGSRKQGYLKWKGILLAAPVGKQVKAIHNGTVLFSDWLKGYGLVTVLDHGAGYMSLYGHNQALLKSVGDRVETGEPIALVGQSGGQSQSGLYFEIRRDGQAVNPKAWFK